MMHLVHANSNRAMFGYLRARLFGRDPSKVIGGGATATIYRERGRCNKLLAVKISNGNGPAKFYFDNEYRILQRLHQANIVKCYGRGTIEQRPFLVFEHVQGHNVNWHIRNRLAKTLSIFEALLVAEEVGNALTFMHEKGMAHADVKPENIIFDRTRGVVKLVDFAFARPVGERLSRETEVRFAHTPGYAPISRIMGKPPSRGDDIYALGVTLYNMLDRDMDTYNLDVRIKHAGLPREVEALLFKMTGTGPYAWDQFADCPTMLMEIRALRSKYQGEA